jgi:hypothetical protein
VLFRSDSICDLHFGPDRRAFLLFCSGLTLPYCLSLPGSFLGSFGLLSAFRSHGHISRISAQGLVLLLPLVARNICTYHKSPLFYHAIFSARGAISVPSGDFPSSLVALCRRCNARHPPPTRFSTLRSHYRRFLFDIHGLIAAHSSLRVRLLLSRRLARDGCHALAPRLVLCERAPAADAPRHDPSSRGPIETASRGTRIASVAASPDLGGVDAEPPSRCGGAPESAMLISQAIHEVAVADV